MSATATTTKSPQRARLACAVVVACAALTPTAYGQQDIEANKARSMRVLGQSVSTTQYDDLAKNKARSMRALGEHLMSR
jgi:hypothetical protein